MRYDSAQKYFDLYVDKAKMLITKKDGLLTGRALVWEINGITLLDRIYTCFDYLENCFIDYAKEHGWWIRENNSLLNTGDDQWWCTPDNNYTEPVDTKFRLQINKHYDYFPYVDSFRYFNGVDTLSTHSEYSCCLDSTDGYYGQCEYICEGCGATFYGTEDDIPEGLHWSEWSNGYYCDDCCWYSDGIDDYVSNSEDAVVIRDRYFKHTYPKTYFDDYFVKNPDGSESHDDIVEIDDNYYFVTDYIIFNVDTNKYEIRSHSS